MLDIEAFIESRYPNLVSGKPLVAKTVIAALRILFHEKEFQQFGREYPHLKGVDFCEQVLRYFDFSYTLRDNERERIPKSGGVVIIANHPIGSLDGLLLLKMVSDVRKDVKVVANELLYSLEPLHSLLLPVDNMGGNTPKRNLQAIRQFLEQDGALIVFPAGEVSRMGAKGIMDGKWQAGFLRIAAAAKAPILPVFVDGRNSSFFYSLSLVAKPLSTLWLVREMFKHASNSVDIRIGELIAYDTYQPLQLSIPAKVKLMRKHLYRVGKDRSLFFDTQKAIAHPEDRLLLRQEIRLCELLGETKDNKKIYLYRHQADSCIMRELGRLRELSFRAVGEGSGTHRDMDRYDQYYFHLILWDEEELEIVGSYRLCDTKQVVDDLGQEHLYLSTLFDFSDDMAPYLQKGLELGRSFVQPKYWGKRSLDYLWYGIGAFLRANPQYQYMFGPVSISDTYPSMAKEMLIYFYRLYYGDQGALAYAKHPYRLTPEVEKNLAPQFVGNDYKRDFTHLKSQLSHMGLTVPTLYKQYTELCEEGGVRFVDFNIDSDFANCVDGLVMVDIERIKESKRVRYMGV